MAEVPNAVLSEHFQHRMEGRRLVSAVFTTFRFEPSFFEGEVLPVFFDVSLSHAGAIKLLQLEEALRALPGHIAVFYDHNGLVADGGSAKLDVRRIPIRHSTGVFHPKNVLALVEEVEADEHGTHARALLCACMSANLTRAGWWENVEVAHVEELAAGARTSLRDSLLSFLEGLLYAAEHKRPNDETRARYPAVQDIRGFLRETTQRDHRSVEGRLLTQFHDGSQGLVDFVDSCAGSAVRGMCLEVVSPYFDAGERSLPLDALLERFKIREARVFLPRGDEGEALCPEGLFFGVQALSNVSWGALPKDLLRLGKSEGVRRRTVHAKIYRFFEPTRGGREIMYVGSTNLTQAGCRLANRGGNVETGFLVEITSKKPDWWLSSETRRPTSFAPKSEDEGVAASGGTKLMLRYWWDRQQAEVFWGGTEPSPLLSVGHAGVAMFQLLNLAPREWTLLAVEGARQVERVLASTSILQVTGESAEAGLLLVQEDGMSHRPSLLLELSAAEILRYWSLLTIEQRAAFIEAHARLGADDIDPLMAKLAPLAEQVTMFDRFAGVFHAFGCLEQRVMEALEQGKTREADYRIFGKKYDSLGNLLDRVHVELADGTGDAVEQYLLTLCAQQLTREVRRTYPAYWASHRGDVEALESLLADTQVLRERLAATHAEMPGFLDWFERKFLKRAEPLENPS